MSTFLELKKDGGLIIMKRKIDSKLVEDYRSAKAECGKLDGDIKTLQANFAKSEEFLANAERELKAAEIYEKDALLVTIKEVEDAREKVTSARTKVDTIQVVCSNLDKSIKRAAGLMPSAQNHELSASRRIFMQHSEALLKEIKELAGEQIDQYIVSLAISHPETLPHPLPGNLGEILRQPERMNSLRNSMREALLKS